MNTMNVQPVWTNQQMACGGLPYQVCLPMQNMCQSMLPMQQVFVPVPMAGMGGVGYGATVLMPQQQPFAMVQNMPMLQEDSIDEVDTEKDFSEGEAEQRQKPWMTEELLQIIEKKRQNYKNYAADPTNPELKKCHIISRKQAMKAVRKAKREFMKTNASKA
eukprot:TRINITY_DN651_c0_g1_i1.p1 TRINITY_DN651_c0_g1~~TRINITY_DN651_c0_g1_i1.p1  ORF type:complete len:161 (+),score=42.77 TRINITY_DN651_c0_g1_i1:505-987(+)